jgi:dienelactone hydrolase
VKPEDPGTIAVSTYTGSLSVPGGLAGRTVHTTVYVPAGVTAAPVVVVHPGFCLDSTLYASYAEHLASRGTVTVLVDPGYPVLTCPAFAPNHTELGQYLVKVLDWIDTEATSGGLAGVADPSKLILAGHSVGGKISALVATTDARPRGVFAIDPVDINSPSVSPELIGLITVPIVALGETTNSTGSGQACAPAADNFQQYAQNATAEVDEIEIVGANHMSFLDNPNCGLFCSVCPAGTDDPTESRRLTRRYLTAFTDMVLRNDTGAREWLAGAPMQADVAAGLVIQQVRNGF